MAKWILEIPNFLGGYAPAYWKSIYPAYGNKNMAGDMKNVDLTYPDFITQGPGLATLTDGDESGKVTTLIKGILDAAVELSYAAHSYSYAVGGNKFYTIHEGAVMDAHTITNADDGEDVAYYNGAAYYSYNYTTGADVGKFDGSTYDDDFMSTVPTDGTTLQSDVPHPLLAAGNDVLYIGNGYYISSYSATNNTFTEAALDLPDDFYTVDLEWANNRIYIAANRFWSSDNEFSFTKANPGGSIFIWDGASPSWEYEIKTTEITALFVKNGIVFVFRRDPDSTARYKLGYISGTQIVDVATFADKGPNYYQVTEYSNFIIWVSPESGKIYAWGAVDKSLPTLFFQLAHSDYDTKVGGLASPFGTPMIASYQSSKYKIAKFYDYTTDCYWKSLLFDVTGDGRKSMIDKIVFNFKKMGTGSRVDWTLRNDNGVALKTGTISYSGDGTATQKISYPKIKTENFRIELDWSNGSTSNPVAIKNIKIYGHTIQ